MKPRLLTLGLISALVAFPVFLRAQDNAKKNVDSREPQTELGDKMEKLNDAYRKLGKQIADATKNEDSLTQVAIIRASAEAALKLEPAKKKDLPEADQAKFVADFRAKMKDFIATVGKLEDALKSNNNADAAKLVDDMKTQRNDDHKQFQKKKPAANVGTNTIPNKVTSTEATNQMPAGNPVAVATTTATKALDGEAVQLAAFTVTGSHIKRLDTESNLPVSILGGAAIGERNMLTPIALLYQIPQVANTPMTEGSLLGGARGITNSVNLRGIGTGNTLILLNGRRIVPYAFGSSIQGGIASAYVNVSVLPTNGIDHIDLLRDGASSIYGTDAVAGVINYVTDMNFRGTEVKVGLGSTEHGDGRESMASIRYGTVSHDGRVRWVSTFNTLYQGSILMRNRALTKDQDHTAMAPAPWNAPSALIPVASNPFYTRSNISPYPSFRVGASTTTTFLVPQGNGTVLATTTVPVRGGVGGGYYFNQTGNPPLQPKSLRLNYFNQAEFDLTRNVTAFAELQYYQSNSTINRFFITYNANIELPIIVPANSPWNPYGQPVTILTQAINQIPIEHDREADRFYRATGGVRGKVGQTWRWEAAAFYNVDKANELSDNSVRASLYSNAITSGAWNPFYYILTNQNGTVSGTQQYQNSVGAVQLFTQTKDLVGKTSMTSGVLQASGDLFNLWAGPVSLAFGGEYRKDEMQSWRTPFSVNSPPGSGLPTDRTDYIQVSPNTNWSAQRTVGSTYAETVIPLAKPKNEVPLVKLLELTAAVRIDHYSDFDSTPKPKFGISWRPQTWLAIRGSHNEGFRAPDIPLVHSTAAAGIVNITDQFLGTTSTGRVNSIGARSLKPETSKGKSAGIVADVPRIKGLSFSVDFWRIEQSNLIVTPALTDIMRNDATLLNAVAAKNPGVPLNQLNIGAGTGNYLGDGRVTRVSGTNAVAAVNSFPFNSATALISGVDYNLTYHVPEISAGRFTVNTDWANITQYYYYAAPGAAKKTLLGFDSNPRLRGNVNLAWRKGNWSANFTSIYTGKFKISGSTLPNSSPALVAQSDALWQSLGAPAYISKTFNNGVWGYYYVFRDAISYNTSIAYRFGAHVNRWLENSTVRLGVINLTGRQPTLSPAMFGYNPATENSLMAGRKWSLDFTKKY